MRWEQMDKIVEEQFEQIREIRRTKGRDYAGDGDTLGNFKRTADEIGLTPEQVWYVFAKKHWDAIIAYVRKGQVESEPIDGRIDDALTYLLLLKGLIVERRENESIFDMVEEATTTLSPSQERRVNETFARAFDLNEASPRVIPIRRVDPEGGDAE